MDHLLPLALQSDPAGGATDIPNVMNVGPTNTSFSTPVLPIGSSAKDPRSSFRAAPAASARSAKKCTKVSKSGRHSVIRDPGPESHKPAHPAGIFVSKEIIMDAASLVKVPDSVGKGINALPAAGPSGTLAAGTVGAGPQPTAAQNSGTKPNGDLTVAKPCYVSSSLSKQYASPDESDVEASTTNASGGDFRPSK